eukprot:scaffold15049_cov517-Ochromonas_danica.AAC.1
MNDFMESDEDEDLTFTQRVEKKGPTLVLPVNLSATTTSKLSSTISDCCRGILAEYKSTIINWRKRALRLGDLKDHRAKGTFPTRLARAPALPQYPSTISEDRRVILRQQHESLWLNFQRSSLDMEIAAIKTDADKLRHEVEMLANTDGAWDTLREKHPDLVKQYETFFLQEFPVVFTRMLTEIQQELKIQDDPFVLPDPTPPPAPPPPPPPPAPPSPLPLPSNALTATSESNSRLEYVERKLKELTLLLTNRSSSPPRQQRRRPNASSRGSEPIARPSHAAQGRSGSRKRSSSGTSDEENRRSKSPRRERGRHSSSESDDAHDRDLGRDRSRSRSRSRSSRQSNRRNTYKSSSNNNNNNRRNRQDKHRQRQRQQQQQQHRQQR